MIKAIRDKVIVKPRYVKEQGGIIIPENCQVFKQYHGLVLGEVVSVGPEYRQTYEGKALRAGDLILFRRHEGKLFVYEGVKYLTLKEKWIEAKVDL